MKCGQGDGTPGVLADANAEEGKRHMKQLSVIVRRDRAVLVQGAFERGAIEAVEAWPTTSTGLGPAPRLQHRGTFYDDDRCVRFEAIVSDMQAEAVAVLIRASLSPQEYLLASRLLDRVEPTPLLRA